MLGLFAESVAEKMQQSAALMDRLKELCRRGHHEPASRRALKEFERFKYRWGMLVAHGAAAGYLDADEHLIEDLVPPVGPWVWDETEDEHRQRIGRDGGQHVTFPVRHRKGPSSDSDQSFTS